MSDSCVNLSELGAGVLSLQISRPEALNALNSDVLKSLMEAIETIQRNTSASAVILSGSGDKAFVAGADIKEMMNYDAAQARAFSTYGQSVLTAMSNLPQIVIAQVQGFALGGGLELALAADFIVASEKAKFGLPEVGLGLIPGFGGTQRLVQRIGYARAIEWMTSAERYNAEVAYQLGLLNRVVAPDALQQTVERLALQIATQGPQAVRSAKRAARAAAAQAVEFGYEFESQLFSSCFSGREAQEGLAAFVEKRRPEFRSLKS